MRRAKISNIDVSKYGYRHEELSPPEDGKIDVKSWFWENRKNLPLELEIGTCKGTFLTEEGERNPDVNYIGIEWAGKYWRAAVKKCDNKKLVNVKVIKTEAKSFISNYISDGIFRKIHIYFPDPWPKRRHHERRLIQESFFKELYRILEPKGIIRILTDHHGYFLWIKKHAGKVPDLFTELPFERPVSAGENELVGTNFERKYIKEGRPFYGVSFLKK